MSLPNTPVHKTFITDVGTPSGVPGCSTTYKYCGIPYRYANRFIYDPCYEKMQKCDITEPLKYRTYQGAVENYSKCRGKYFIRPYDLVDIESELKNMTRPASECPQKKYLPIPGDCKECKPEPKKQDLILDPSAVSCPSCVKTKLQGSIMDDSLAAINPYVAGFMPSDVYVDCNLKATIPTYNNGAPLVFNPEICAPVWTNMMPMCNKGF